MSAFIDVDWIHSSRFFGGVKLIHIVISEHTDGEFSFPIVQIAPNKKIGNHVHILRLYFFLIQPS